MEDNKIKENLEKLLYVSSPIVDLYFELIDKLRGGEGYNNVFSIVSKLKIRISMEETILCSFSKDEIEKMRQNLSDMIAIAQNNKDMYYGKQVFLMTRLLSLLTQREEILNGKGVVLQKNSNMSLSFGKVDSIVGFFYVKSLLKFKDDLSNNNLGFSISNDMKLSLIREMYLYMYTLFARFRFMELLLFLFYSEPNLDNLNEDDLKSIETVILGFDEKRYNNVLNIMSEYFIEKISYISIDVSDMDSFNEGNSKEVFNYLIYMNSLDVVLSYYNSDLIEDVERYLDDTYSLDEIRKLLGEEFCEDEVDEYIGIRKIQFESESVEELVRQKVDEYKGKKRK